MSFGFVFFEFVKEWKFEEVLLIWESEELLYTSFLPSLTATSRVQLFQGYMANEMASRTYSPDERAHVYDQLHSLHARSVM